MPVERREQDGPRLGGCPPTRPRRPRGALLLMALGLPLLISQQAFAWDQPLRQGKSWFIPINVGVGPGVTMLPGVLSDTLYPTVSMEAFGVVDPRIIRHYIKRYRHKVPKQWRGCLNLINTTTPWHVKAGPAGYIPAHLILAPENPLVGDGRYAFGIQTEPLFADVGFIQGGTDEVLFMKLFIGAPTLSYMFVQHPALKNASHIVGLGGRLKWQLTFQPHERIAITLQWLSVLQITNAYETKDEHDEVALGVGNASVQLWDSRHERAWHVGTFSVLFNWRFPFYINPGM